MITPAKIVQDWECSLDILNEKTYQRVQHASLYSSIPSSTTNSFYLRKAKKNESYFRERKHSVAKLPLVSHDKLQGKENEILIRVLDESSGKNCSLINTKKEMILSTRKISETIGEKDNKNDPLSVKENLSIHRVSSKSNLSTRRSFLRQSIVLNGKDKCLFYTNHISNQIFKVIENSEERITSLKSLTEDIQLLISNFDKTRSVFGTQQKMRAFKKSEGLFLFKNQEIRILFHALLAEIEICLNNIQSAIEEFEFCEYKSRKENNEQLTICFLEQISELNISILNYEQADETLRNIMELAIVYKKQKALKYALERISLVYYYRGNSIMGKHYLKKSEEGMTAFENEIYSREFSQIDEIKRLESKLFNLKNEEKIIKRKNNPKFEFDIWRESKEDYEKQSYESYMEKVNKMLKHHENSKDGRKIMGMTSKINCIGEVKRSLKKDAGNENLHLRQSSVSSKASNSLINANDTNQNSNCFAMWGTPPLENVTGVIKTHLSMNRENNKLTREQRWKKITNFIFSLYGKLKEATTHDFPERQLSRLRGLKDSNSKLL